MKKTAKWGWSLVGSDTARGPFPSREAALKSARGERETGDKVEVGVCEYADPVMHVYIDVDRLLEGMDQYAHDNDFSFCDEEIFQVRGGQKGHDAANAALEKLLQAWAKKWLTSSVWVLGKAEEVTL